MNSGKRGGVYGFKLQSLDIVRDHNICTALCTALYNICTALYNICTALLSKYMHNWSPPKFCVLISHKLTLPYLEEPLSFSSSPMV